MTHLRRVFTLFKEAGLNLKLNKRKFFSDAIDYIDHVIRPGLLEFMEQKSDEIPELKDPTKFTELKSFLGFWNVFRSFVPKISRILAQLNANLQKDQLRCIAPLRDKEKAKITELKERLI